MGSSRPPVLPLPYRPRSEPVNLPPARIASPQANGEAPTPAAQLMLTPPAADVLQRACAQSLPLTLACPQLAARGQVVLLPHGAPWPQGPCAPVPPAARSMLGALPTELFEAVLDATALDVADLLQLRLLNRRAGARVERYLVRRHANALASRLANTLLAEPFHQHNVYRAPDGTLSHGHAWRPRFAAERRELLAPDAFWTDVAAATHTLTLPRTSPNFLPSLALFAAHFRNVRHLTVSFPEDHTYGSRALHALARDGHAGFWPHMQGVRAEGDPSLARRLLGICRGGDADVVSTAAVSQWGNVHGRHGIYTRPFLRLLGGDELLFTCDVLPTSPFESVPRAATVAEEQERIASHFWDVLQVVNYKPRRLRLRRLVFRVRAEARHASGLAAVYDALQRAIAQAQASGAGWRFDLLRRVSGKLSVVVASCFRADARTPRSQTRTVPHGPPTHAARSLPWAQAPGLYLKAQGEALPLPSLLDGSARWSEGLAFARADAHRPQSEAVG